MNSKAKEIRQNFMRETLSDLWNYYEKCLNDDEFKTWDWIVLTASNEEQAKIYNYEIEYRLKQNALPKNINYLVLSDPGNKRVGSGGATLNVLNEIKKRETRGFDDIKILTIHSGGDSKRVPQYSVCGKLFSTVQRQLPNGRSSSLFDEFLITFLSVANRMQSGMVLLSGDVLLNFNPLQIELFNLDSAAISIKENVHIGKEHGVFLSNEKGELLEFLHKFSVKELRNKGAVNSIDNVDLDTGAIYLNSSICNELFSIISINGCYDKKSFDKYVNDDVRLSLYGDFLYPLAKKVKFEDYLKQAAEGTLNENLKNARKVLWEKLSKYNMKIIKTSPSKFIHFGTTKELKELMTTKIDDYKYLGWKKRILTNNLDNIEVSSNCSYINKNSILGQNCYIEKSFIDENCKIGNNVVLSNVHIKNVVIPSNVCLNTLKQLDGTYITRIYSIDENPKLVKKTGTQFLLQDLIDVMNYYNIPDNLVWNCDEKSLWEAKFYKCCNTEEESVKSSLELYEIFNKRRTKTQVKEYFKCDRKSLRQSFNDCDAIHLKEEAENIEIFIRTLNYFNLLEKKCNLKIANDIILKSPNLEKQKNEILKLVDKQKYYVKYRAYLSLSLLSNNVKINNSCHLHYEDLCYDKIKNAVGGLKFHETANYKTKEESIVELPIRVNFAGGWSDTPPYCIENGGSVLNAAFKLNGKYPIRAIIRKIKDSKIILKSIDLDSKKEVLDIKDLKNCSNSNDSFSLLKASLLVTGVVNKEDNTIEDVINRVGSGFEFITDVDCIPKGSGLGTSSILSAACLKAIYDFLGVNVSYEQLASKVLEQEQLMGTGGGWQDQIGGLVPGIKLITTKKGKIQQFNIKNIELSKEFENLFNNKFALIYTGQRRLAKNLLRNIMNSYIIGEENVVKNISKIKVISRKMTDAIEKNDIKKFANLLNKHWELSKKLDKGCTNSCINQILDSCEDLIDAKMICGAGGGGFLQVVLKENISKDELKNRIDEIFQDSGIKVYDVTLVKEEK